MPLFSIDFRRNFQSAPVDLLQFVVSIAVALLADPIPFCVRQFHSKMQSDQLIQEHEEYCNE